MPQFSLRQLMLATTLVALGLAGLFGPAGIGKLLGFPLLGAGVFTPFGRPWLGAIAGFLIPVTLLFLLMGAWTIYGNPD